MRDRQRAGHRTEGSRSSSPKSVDPYIVKDPEAMAMNFARALGKPRQGGLRLACPARKRRDNRQARRADDRHGQDALQGHRILDVRSAPHLRGADAADEQLFRRLDALDAAHAAARPSASPSRAAQRQALFRSPTGRRTRSSISCARSISSPPTGRRRWSREPKGSTSTRSTRPPST